MPRSANRPARGPSTRRWHFTVANEPTLKAYRDELRSFIESSRDEIEPLRQRASAALGQLGQHRWTTKVRHPLVVRQLPSAAVERLALLDRINWQPLELQQAAVEAEDAPSPDVAADPLLDSPE